LSQLQTCTVYPIDSINNVIIPRFVEVCKKGSNVDHPYGSREVSPDSSLAFGQFRTFDDVINNYNSTHGITTNQFCSADLITYPGLYSKQSMQVNEPTYSKPDTCTCNRINQIYIEYASYGAQRMPDMMTNLINEMLSNPYSESLRNLIV
jgi:hypothetical protein